MKCNQIQCEKCIEKCRVHSIHSFVVVRFVSVRSFVRSLIRGFVLKNQANMLKLFILLLTSSRDTITRYYFVIDVCKRVCVYIRQSEYMCVCLCATLSLFLNYFKKRSVCIHGIEQGKRSEKKKRKKRTRMRNGTRFVNRMNKSEACDNCLIMEIFWTKRNI